MEYQSTPAIYQNEEAALTDLGSGIGRICFFSKGNSLSPKVRTFIREVLEHDAHGFDGLVLVNEGKNFSVGADLTAMLASIDAGDYGDPTAMNGFQEIQMMLKTYHKPIVAAPFKNVLGGGLELCMHCHGRVALRKLYMGLVEVGVGLLPAGGGLKECALTISAAEPRLHDQVLLTIFSSLILRTVSKDAPQALDMGYLRPCDPVVEQQEDLLDAAKKRCLSLIPGFTPKRAANEIRLGGRRDYEKMLAHMEALQSGGQISPYDVEIGKRIARVLAGSDQDSDVCLTEEQLCILENLGMWELKQQKGTQDRIRSFLRDGVMLRN